MFWPGAEGGGAAAAGRLFIYDPAHTFRQCGRGAGIKHCLELRAGRRLVEHSALDVVTGETFNLSKNLIGLGLLDDISTQFNAQECKGLDVD